jgi:hypothetical protein
MEKEIAELRKIQEKCNQKIELPPNQDNEILKETVKKLEKQMIQLKEKQIISEQKQENIEKHIDELENKPRTTQNILQIVCINQNDNYLDYLFKKKVCQKFISLRFLVYLFKKR